MKNLKSLRYLSSNLHNYMMFRKYDSIADLSIELKIKERTLLSWINLERVPSLKVIDEIANILQVPASNLIGKNIDFHMQELFNIENDSCEEFARNFRKYIIRHHINSAVDFEAMFDDDYGLKASTYYSYTKNKYSCPSLYSLEILAKAFGEPTNKLIERSNK